MLIACRNQTAYYYRAQPEKWKTGISNKTMKYLRIRLVTEIKYLIRHIEEVIGKTAEFAMAIAQIIYCILSHSTRPFF